VSTQQSTEDLISHLQSDLGVDRVITDADRRRLLSSDFYSEGRLCATAIRPANTASLSNAVRTITAAGYAVIPRGGGMSYTGGYTPPTDTCVIVDTTDMSGIVDFDPRSMTLTVRAGTTWETIYDELKPHGLRLPFFGTFSGRLATVGGGLSNGALFFGTARYGSAADNTLGLEVVCADGQVLRTGQAAFRNGKPFYRTHGPDLTGLFLHDCGALGIKTEATFRLIEAPSHEDFLSFAFADAATVAAALSAVARSGATEEAYVFDPATTARNMASGDLRSDVRRLGEIVKSRHSVAAGLKAGARVVAAGKRLVPEGAWSLHMTCAGRTKSAVEGDLARCREILHNLGGSEIANSIPLAARAAPFDSLNSALGPDGERWAALNAKVTHEDAAQLIDSFDAIVARNSDRMQALNVTVSTLFIAMNTHAFSLEPVFHWHDRWLPMHREVPDADHLAKLTEAPDNPDAAALVAELRRETANLFSDFGAASNQIGRTYVYRENLDPATRALLDALKAELDPAGLMNPGVLGY
jgi:D-lactate dehydrogenase (cytochrome)